MAMVEVQVSTLVFLLPATDLVITLALYQKQQQVIADVAINWPVMKAPDAVMAC